MRALLLVVLTLVAAASATVHSHGDRVVSAILRLTDMSSAAQARREHELFVRSTPGSPMFRQHMSHAEVAELFGASQATIDNIIALLVKQYDVERSAVTISRHRDSLFVGPISDNMRFADVVQQASSPQSGASVAPTPSGLASAGVQAILVPRRTASKTKPSRVGSFPGASQDPTTIRARYAIPAGVVSGGSQAVAEFEDEQFYQSNVNAFFERYLPDATPTVVKVLGPNKGGYFGEGNLDLEYIAGLAPNATTWWVAEKDFDLTAWVERFLTLDPLPTVASISWGSGESGFEMASLDSDNQHFMRLGLLGVTVLAASGDQGTGSTGFFSCGTFDPNWPASSPYVTAVGATYSTNATGGEEIAWSGSGGGFSSKFTRPNWQAASVASYLNTTSDLPPQQYWNRTGRATPDVAAVGTNFEVYSFGWGLETGTSAATPTFASIITRLNANRVNSGKAPLGFINPSLYSASDIGQDVTTGNNKNPSCPAGFAAAPGWDPVSGLGTPNFDVLASALA